MLLKGWIYMHGEVFLIYSLTSKNITFLVIQDNMVITV